MSSGAPTPQNSKEELLDLVNKQAATIEQLESKVRWFEEQFHLSRHKQFGASSERSVHEQGALFNEAEVIAEAGPVEEEIRQNISYERKKTGRRPVPKDLPIERIEYRIPQEERICTCCGGAMHEMSTEIRHEVIVMNLHVLNASKRISELCISFSVSACKIGIDHLDLFAVIQKA